jgi:predicted ATP-grasp superfamily ATP-dependent carboligase
MTVLVTDAHYRMSVALIRDLAEGGARVLACERSRFPDPPGFFSRGAARCETLPEDGWEAALLALCLRVAKEDGEKPVLLPVGAATLALLARERARFSAAARFAVPTPEQLDLFNDKAAAARLAESLGVPVPRGYEAAPDETDAAFFARVPLPCVVKPLCGERFGLHAEQRYAIARTKEELEAAWRRFYALAHEAPVVQEYLPGGGFGCSVLAENGRVVCSICHRRVREYPVSGGPSSCCESAECPELGDYAARMVEKTGYTGLAMFEFKQDAAGQKRFLEINPRVWGTYPLTRASGSNFAALWLAVSAGEPLPACRAPRPVRMVYYPSDLAAALGYLKRGNARAFFGALGDLFRPSVRNGLRERGDPGPWRAYLRNLRRHK